jgi:hypothetical protein
MRWILSAVVLLAAAACSPTHVAPPDLREHAGQSSQWCFHSTQGIDVFVKDGVACPLQGPFSRDADRVMSRANLGDGAFIGVRVVYVRGEIECAGIQTLGCSDVNRRISLVSLDCPWPRKLTQHELGHQAVQARGMPERAQDHDDPWWRR